MPSTMNTAAWRFHNPVSAYLLLAFWAATATIVIAVTAFALAGLDRTTWALAAAFIVTANIVLTLMVWLGSFRSGWANLWTIQTEGEVRQVSSLVEQVLSESGMVYSVKATAPKPRWLRRCVPPFELADGTRVWLMALPGLQGETLVAIQRNRAGTPEAVESMKRVLSSVLRIRR